MSFPGINWQAASIPRQVAKAEIDLWQIDLDTDPECLASHFNLLSAVERERATKYVFPKDRNQFIVCRGTLRKILSGYIGVPPGRVSLGTGRFGKPFISSQENGFRFNVSHSRGIAVVAVSRYREVGVDIEFVESNLEVLSLASAVFSQPGISRLRALPSQMQAGAFFSGWTRKEAFLKAIGDGLLSSNEAQSAAFAINDQDLTVQASVYVEGTCWSLIPLEIQEGFKAALVVERSVGTVRMCQLSPNC